MSEVEGSFVPCPAPGRPEDLGGAAVSVRRGHGRARGWWALLGGSVALALWALAVTGLLLPTSVASLTPLSLEVVAPAISRCNSTLDESWYSGYYVQTCTTPPVRSIIQNVSGEWIVPTVNCGVNTWISSQGAVDIGLDGVTNSTEGGSEEIGMEMDCNPPAGASYWAWFESGHGGWTKISLVISPGDTMYATVTEGGGHYFLTLRDATSGQSFSTIQNNANENQSTAQWLVTYNIGHDLSNFGTVSFFNCRVVFYGTAGGINGGYWSHMRTVITNSNNAILSEPTNLTAAGSAFTIVYNPLQNCSLVSSPSYEWGGYVDHTCQDDNYAFTDVKATWVQPAPAAAFTCPAFSFAPYTVLIGVGIGGYSATESPHDFEGIGTSITCIRGVLSYGAWWATPLAYEKTLPLTLAVRPGDTYTAEVSYYSSNRSFLYTLTDLTTKMVTGAELEYMNFASWSSAEWLVEQGHRFNNIRGGYLLNFGTFTFRACSVTIGGQSEGIFGAGQTINQTLVRGPSYAYRTLAANSPLQSGNSFTVTWQNTS